MIRSPGGRAIGHRVDLTEGTIVFYIILARAIRVFIRAYRQDARPSSRRGTTPS